MRKVILLTMLLLLYCVSAALAQDCEKIVADYDGALRGQEAQVEKAAQPLINEGADVRVRVVGTTINLDQDVKQLIQSCPSWQARDGGQKNNLIVLMASPKSRKVGMYIGGLWSKPLADHWVRIKQEQMAPRFRDGDFAGGFIGAEQHLAMRLAAAKDEAVHPNQTVTQNAAVDMSGFWSFLKWFLFSLVGGVGLWAFIHLLGKRKRDLEAISAMQQEAAVYRTRCSAFINDGRAKNESWAGDWLDRYTELIQSEKLNPDTSGLSLAEYQTIKTQWEDLYNAMYKARLGRAIREEDTMPKPQPKPQPKPEKSKPKKHRPQPTEEEAAETTRAQSSVLSGNTIIAPVIVNEEKEDSWHGGSHHSSWASNDDDDRRSSSSSSSDDSSSSSGGSSDWGSSSSSDSGGSSDFGSSDSGSSGGSSDF